MNFRDFLKKGEQSPTDVHEDPADPTPTDPVDPPKDPVDPPKAEE